MIRSGRAVKYILVDWVASSVAWFLFDVARYQAVAASEGFATLGDYLSYHVLLWEQLLVPVGWVALFWLSGYYNKPVGKSRLTELFSTLGSVLTGCVLLYFALVLNDLPVTNGNHYTLFGWLFGTQFTCVYLPRLSLTCLGMRRVKRREEVTDVLLIGAGAEAARIADELYKLGYHIVGFVSDSREAVAEGVHPLGTLGELPRVVASRRVDELVVVPEERSGERLTELLYSLYAYKRPIKVLADKASLLSLKIKAIKGVPLVDVTDNNFLPIEQNIKWLMDKVLSMVALVTLSPLFLYISWRVRRDSPGPVLFTQERVGYMGRPFRIYKFRTMYVDAEREGPSLSSEDDRRVTPFGRVMRKYRLDELPQFWNVLRGDMSLVGPRPERRYFIDCIVRRAPYYYLLHNVRPGITSLGMVKYGYAGDVDQMVERLAYDILYYENMSLAMDIKILIYTVKTVFTGKGI